MLIEIPIHNAIGLKLTLLDTRGIILDFYRKESLDKAVRRSRSCAKNFQITKINEVGSPFCFLVAGNNKAKVQETLDTC